MESNVDYWLDRIEETVDTRLEASGFVLDNGIKDSIRDKGLIDTGHMINDIQHVRVGNEVRSGSTIDDPPYPLFLNNGFRHHESGELIGPYRFMEDGAAWAEGELRLIWKQPIGGR